MASSNLIIVITQHFTAVFSEDRHDPFERALKAFVRQRPPNRWTVTHSGRDAAQGRMDHSTTAR